MINIDVKLNLPKGEMKTAIAAAMKRCAALAATLVKKEFATSTSPASAAWAPLKSGGRSTGGSMPSTVSSTATADDFNIVVSHPASGYFDRGTRKQPARQILPADGNIPAEWSAQFEAIIEEEIKKAMK